MTASVPRETLAKVKKLVLLPEEVRKSGFAVSVTRLTVLKSLCQEQQVANRSAHKCALVSASISWALTRT